MREVYNPLLAAALGQTPGIRKRTIIEAKFVDQGETVATVRASKRESFLQRVGMGISYTDPPSPEGHIVFSAERVVTLPIIGDVKVGREELGKSPDGFDRALEMLGE